MGWLFVIIMSYVMANNKNSIARIERHSKSIKNACERDKCSHMPLDEGGMNCVNECTSSICYGEVYLNNPLEDGEIDNFRSRTFSNCLRRIFKEDEVTLFIKIIPICFYY